MTKNLIRKKNTTSQQVDKKYCSARTMNEGFKKKMNQQQRRRFSDSFAFSSGASCYVFQKTVSAAEI